MNLVNDRQSAWIFKKANELTNKYSTCFPTTDEEWTELKNEAEKIISESKGNELCIKVMLCILDYFNLVYNENMKGD